MISSRSFMVVEVFGSPGLGSIEKAESWVLRFGCCCCRRLLLRRKLSSLDNGEALDEHISNNSVMTVTFRVRVLEIIAVREWERLREIAKETTQISTTPRLIYSLSFTIVPVSKGKQNAGFFAGFAVEAALFKLFPRRFFIGPEQKKLFASAAVPLKLLAKVEHCIQRIEGLFEFLVHLQHVQCKR